MILAALYQTIVLHPPAMNPQSKDHYYATAPVENFRQGTRALGPDELLVFPHKGEMVSFSPVVDQRCVELFLANGGSK